MVKYYNINDMKGGWFIGDFLPSVYRTKDIEIGLKLIPQGTKSDGHYHKNIQELTVFLSGSGIYIDTPLREGDIIMLEPGDKNYIKFLEDSYILCIKWPSIPDDKFY